MNGADEWRRTKGRVIGRTKGSAAFSWSGRGIERGRQVDTNDRYHSAMLCKCLSVYERAHLLTELQPFTSQRRRQSRQPRRETLSVCLNLAILRPPFLPHAGIKVDVSYLRKKNKSQSNSTWEHAYERVWHAYCTCTLYASVLPLKKKGGI